MSNTPRRELDEHTAQLWRAYTELGDRIAELTAQQKAIGDTLRERCTAPGAYAYDGATVGTVQPSRSFDVARALLFLPADQASACLKPAEWDAKAIKRRLTPAQVEACMVESGQRKLIRP